MKLNLTNSVILGFVILIVLGGAYKMYERTLPGEYDDFAQCLTDNGAIMYGAYWCGNCQAQKQMFGKSFEFLNYVECTENEELCKEQKIEGYPTWKLKKDGVEELISQGLASFTTLAEKYSCEMPVIK